MIFANSRLILAGGVRDGLEIVVADGKFEAIRERTSASAIDLGGNYLAPGFIDLHIHGALGRDTMEASSEAFQMICDYHASGGTTSLLLTTATAPDPGNRERPARRASRYGRYPADCWASISKVLSFPKREPARNGLEFIRDPNPNVLDRLLSFAHVIKIMTLAPELPEALAMIGRLCLNKIIVSGGHSDASDVEAQAGFEYGMRQVTHTFNAMSSARRRGIYREAGLLEFALSEPDIICELIADGHHVSPTLMKCFIERKGRAGFVW